MNILTKNKKNGIIYITKHRSKKMGCLITEKEVNEIIAELMEDLGLTFTEAIDNICEEEENSFENLFSKEEK